MMPGDVDARAALNVFFDVDQTLVHIDQHRNVLRPGAHEAMGLLKAAVHRIYVWSAGGRDDHSFLVAKYGGSVVSQFART